MQVLERSAIFFETPAMQTSLSEPIPSPAPRPELTPWQSLMQNVDSLLPVVPGEDVSTTMLYINGNRKKQLYISGDRYPNGSLRKVEFYLRDGKDADLVKLSNAPAASRMWTEVPDKREVVDIFSSRMLKARETHDKSLWLGSLVEAGSAERPKGRIARLLGCWALKK